MIGVTNKQIAMRLGQMVLVLLGISFITFCLVMLAPGDPVRQMIAGNEDIVVSQVEIDALRHELGLDQPFLMQYLKPVRFTSAAAMGCNPPIPSCMLT